MYLGIDCGTQGTKALLVSSTGKSLGRGYAPHRLIENPTGAREQMPEWWMEALVKAVCEALPEDGPTAVEGLGVSGQQHGLVVLDEAMHVIRPAKLWNDTETNAQNELLLKHFGGAKTWFERFGIVPRTGYTVSKLLWIAQTHQDDFARIRHILLPHEYLNWRLTGSLAAEPGDASGTGYYDNRSRTWAADVLDYIDGGTGQLIAALPPLIQSTQAAGNLTHQIAEQLGIKGTCLVSSGGGDNMMGAIGTGNVREGVVTLSLGTSSTVYSYSNGPSGDSSGDVASFCASSDGWLPLVCTMNATNVVTATVRLLGKTVEDIDAALNETQPGADGLIFLPFLNGERTPNLPNARGTLIGISAVNFTASHLIRAAVEGVSFGILNGLDLILKGRPADIVQVIGGGARSNAWRTLLADATGACVISPAEQEAGCLGAAIQAYVCVQMASGNAITFEQAYRTFASSDPANFTAANSQLKSAYDYARRRYSEHLRSLYPNA